MKNKWLVFKYKGKGIERVWKFSFAELKMSAVLWHLKSEKWNLGKNFKP